MALLGRFVLSGVILTPHVGVTLMDGVGANLSPLCLTFVPPHSNWTQKTRVIANELDNPLNYDNAIKLNDFDCNFFCQVSHFDFISIDLKLLVDSLIFESSGLKCQTSHKSLN